MEMNKIKTIYIWACLGIISLGVILYGYWYFIDGEYINIPLTFKTTTIVTDKQTYLKSDPIAIKWDYCKGVNTVSDVSITLTDGIIYFLPSIQSNRSIGCYNDFSVVSKIPDAIPVGDYKLNGVIHFRINPVKNIDYKVESTVFYIK
jgi:hypothetical protein